MDETSFEAAPPFAPEKKKINKRFIYLIIVIVVLGLLFFLFSSLNTKTQKAVSEKPAMITQVPIESEPTEMPTNTPEPTISESPTATPTEKPTPKPTVNPIDKTSGLDRSMLSITVQNGSGEAGVGAKGSDYLKSLGYDVLVADNADNYDYTNVTIKIKSAKKDYLDLLKKDLGVNYTIGDTTSDLDTGSASDALVIIGK